MTKYENSYHLPSTYVIFWDMLLLYRKYKAKEVVMLLQEFIEGATNTLCVRKAKLSSSAPAPLCSKAPNSTLKDSIQKKRSRADAIIQMHPPPTTTPQLFKAGRRLVFTLFQLTNYMRNISMTFWMNFQVTFQFTFQISFQMSFQMTFQMSMSWTFYSSQNPLV